MTDTPFTLDEFDGDEPDVVSDPTDPYTTDTEPEDDA